MTAPTLPPSAGTAPASGPPGRGGPRRAYRRTEEGWVGGVAAGVGEHLGVPVLWMRSGFVVATVLSGFGLVLYAALWLVLPAQRHFGDEAPGLAAARRGGRRPSLRAGLLELSPLVALGAVVLGLGVLVTGLTGAGSVLWPLLLGVAGVAVLWRQADEAQRARWRDSRGRVGALRAVLGDGGSPAAVRIGGGLALLFAAVTLFALRSSSWHASLGLGVATLVGVVGLALLLGPWLVRLSADLDEERAERVRSQERADVAAHLHDSVLQTLALIQRSAGDPDRVARLARAQERDLRSWLFTAAGSDPALLSATMQRLASEVEEHHGVPVEVVCVGDRAVSPAMEPLVLAAREAVVNAAVHSGAPRVDVYAEVTTGATEVFVRDRGVGFDPEDVAPDRHGLRHSVLDRMIRRGGTAEVSSVPGLGTEIRLVLPGPGTGPAS